MEDITKRFLDACNYLKDNKHVKNLTELGLISNISKSMLTDMKKGRTNVGAQTIQKLITHFPVINSEWILNGVGEMVTIKPKVYNYDTIKERVISLISSVGLSKERIIKDLSLKGDFDLSNEIDGVGSYYFILDLCKTYGFNIEWIYFGEGDKFTKGLKSYESFNRMEDKFKANIDQAKFHLDVINDLMKNSDENLSNEDKALYAEIINNQYNAIEENNKSWKALQGESESIKNTKGKELFLYKDYLEIKPMEQGNGVSLIDLGRLQAGALLPLVTIHFQSNYVNDYDDATFIERLPKYVHNIYDTTFFLLSNTFYRAFEVAESLVISENEGALKVGDVVVGFNIHLKGFQLSLMDGKVVIVITKEKMQLLKISSYNKRTKTYIFLTAGGQDLILSIENIKQMFMIVSYDRRII